MNGASYLVTRPHCITHITAIAAMDQATVDLSSLVIQLTLADTAAIDGSAIGAFSNLEHHRYTRWCDSPILLRAAPATITVVSVEPALMRTLQVVVLTHIPVVLVSIRSRCQPSQER